MTVRLINPSAPVYEGLSSDQKPAGTEVLDGSVFREVDTGREWYLLSGIWYERLTAAAQSEAGAVAQDTTTQESILSELRRIRFGLELYLGRDMPDPG